MYFNNFPTMLYDFEVGSTSKKDYRVVLDITRNVRFRKAMLENITTYDYYDIGEGETPEMISEKIYGTPQYHWVIMLANQRYDYVNDFPLAQFELEARVDSVYGVGNRYNTHHFLKNGAITEGSVTLGATVAVVGGSVVVSVGDVLTSVNGYSARVDTVTLIGSVTSGLQGVSMACSMRSGNIVVNDVLTAHRTTATPYSITATSFVVNSGYTPVSNYAYEDSVNESKRRVKIINPALVASILKEFSALI